MNVNWLEDHRIYKCPSCKVEFSFLLRKHHCRRCGFIYCKNCINAEKICYRCFKYTKPLQINLIHVLKYLKLNINDYFYLKNINKLFYKNYNEYIKKFKILYFKIPTYYNYNNSLIIDNKEIIINTRWYLHLFNTKHVSSIFTDKMDVISIINTLYINSFLYNNNNIDCYIEKLYKNPLDNLFEYSYYFIDLLLIYNYSDDYVNFIKYLLGKLIVYKEKINFFFWQFNYYYFSKKLSIYDELIKDLIKIINSLNINKLFIKTYDFCKNLSILNKDSENYKNILTHLQKNNYFVSEFLLPLYNDYGGFKLSNIKKISSNSNPIQLQFNNKISSINILFKNGEIQKEFIIMNLIIIFKNYLILKHNMDLKIITYDIVPLFKDNGIIEMIDNCESLYNIKEYHKMTIQNYIFEKNNNLTINDFRKNFIKSCAPTIVISYIFGVGDRHLENILITEDGYIFNIDFEYLLGNEPSFMFKSNNIRITYDMLDALGGINSKYYQSFIEICVTCFQNLRNLNILIFNTFISINYYSKDHLYNYFNNIFFSDLSIEEASDKFKDLLDNSCKNIYTYSLRDYIHKYVKNQY